MVWNINLSLQTNINILKNSSNKSLKAYGVVGHSNLNHVHSILVTLIIIKFPMISVVPK